MIKMDERLDLIKRRIYNANGPSRDIELDNCHLTVIKKAMVEYALDAVHDSRVRDEAEEIAEENEERSALH